MPWQDAEIVQSWQDAEIVNPQLKSEQAMQSIYNDPRGAVLTIGSSLAAEPIAGLAGIAGSVSGALSGNDTAMDRGNRWLEKTRDALTIEPLNPASEKVVETVGKAGEKVIRGVRHIPAAMATTTLEDPGSMAEQRAYEDFPQEERQKVFDQIVDDGFGDFIGEGVLSVTGSPLLAALASISPEATVLVAGGKTQLGKNKPVKAPSIDEMKAAATELYKTVDNAGVTISSESASKAYDTILRAAESQGLRKKLTPDSYAAIKELANDIKKGDLTLQKAEELRRVIQQAQGALKPADKGMATRILRQWDEYIENLKPSDVVGGKNPDEVIQYLKQARELWSRSRKTEVIEEMIRKARENAAGQTGMSGLSHALRTQFLQLVRNEKRFKMFTPDEQAAIRLVARGDSIERFARLLGKFAVKNPWDLAGGLASGGALGYLMGGAGSAGTGAIAVPVIGGIAKMISNRRTEQFARQASEAMRLPAN